MDFFERQEKTRRQTRVLVLLFLLATVLIVVAVGFVAAVVAASLGTPDETIVIPGPQWARDNVGLIAFAALGTLVFIGVASLYRTLRLSAGGGDSVARKLGGTPVAPDSQDPLRARLRNVVEEMAIASGVPVPDIYVLEAEPGINAFAAGYSPGDAAIAVTRGALDQLSRDELQGVIAHEFSHVLNGDMRLNMRLIGLLFGILAISLIGRSILNAGRHTRVRNSGRGGAGVAIFFAAGLALFVVGYIGVLCGRIIKAAASRERERLADASAVQFTRQTEGLAGALKKIAGLDAGAVIKSADGEEVSHMLFAMGVPSLTQMFATHPPLGERIKALDPAFDPRELDRLRAEGIARSMAAAVEPEVASGLTETPKATKFAITPAMILASAGAPNESHVEYARALRAAIPPRVYYAAHSPADAVLLVIALLLHPDQSTRHKQLEHVEYQFGRDRRAKVESLRADLGELGAAVRLPLLDIAMPTLRHRPQDHLEFLADQLRQLADIDGRVELFEYALLRVLETELETASWPADGGKRVRRADQPALRRAVLDLFAILARHGHANEASATAAFAQGLETVFGTDAAPGKMPDVKSGGRAEALDGALGILRNLHGASRRRLVAGLAATVIHDGTLSADEAELLRVICASLDTPLPPLLAA
ncbi:MAG: M48 family metallopeptidase [Gammaproteobacteria bacterium]